ncbi:Competence protein TfoX [Tenacibaculum maritimum]|uniref:TfoX/Sxy family protein n=1 Tax=Tenacibaculum maritimum TaxID=107401 RepID=UPI0012E47BD6|nr:TfoX/Sxy family protein [Tenacibaculum maritimum]CAA0144573.1 Competence protein TfoX [Tenacibaculum maritimum]
MATDKNFMLFVTEQLENAGVITAKRMFGQYAIYSDGIVFGFIANNQLFIKPTNKGRIFIGDVIEVPAYPKAKPSFLIEDKIEDREWLSELIRITVKELKKR